MIKGLYCVRDYKVGYTAVITDENDSVARRALKMALSPDTLMYNNPKDFALFKVGEFDTDTGIITPCEPTLIEEVYNLFSELSLISEV